MSNSANIRQAFETTITVFGERLAQGLIEEMATNGIYLNDPYLSFDKLAFGLERIMGFEASQLIVERVITRLDEMYNEKMLPKTRALLSKN